MNSNEAMTCMSPLSILVSMTPISSDVVSASVSSSVQIATGENEYTAEKDFIVDVNEYNKTVIICGYTGTNSVVNIPPTFFNGKYSVSCFNGYFLENTKTHITSLTINSMDRVGSIFQGYKYLTDLTINNVNKIDNDAFEGCNALTNVTLNNIETVGNQYYGNACVFAECKSLTSAILNNIEYVNGNIFFECDSLVDITLTNIRHLSEHAFCKCEALKSIIIPEGITEINSALFSSCTSLCNVIIPNTVKKICPSAFNNCVSLKKIVIPYGVEVIDEYAFYGCDLDAIYLPTSIKNIKARSIGYSRNIDTFEIVKYENVQIYSYGDDDNTTILNYVSKNDFKAVIEVDEPLIDEPINQAKNLENEFVHFSMNDFSMCSTELEDCNPIELISIDMNISNLDLSSIEEYLCLFDVFFECFSENSKVSRFFENDDLTWLNGTSYQKICDSVCYCMKIIHENIGFYYVQSFYLNRLNYNNLEFNQNLSGKLRSLLIPIVINRDNEFINPDFKGYLNNSNTCDYEIVNVKNNDFDVGFAYSNFALYNDGIRSIFINFDLKMFLLFKFIMNSIVT